MTCRNKDGKYDVYFGRGRLAAKQPGNIRYKELLYENYEAFNATQSRSERDSIADSIVTTMKRLGAKFWYLDQTVEDGEDDTENTKKVGNKTAHDHDASLPSSYQDHKEDEKNDQHHPPQHKKLKDSSCPCPSNPQCLTEEGQSDLLRSDDMDHGPQNPPADEKQEGGGRYHHSKKDKILLRCRMKAEQDLQIQKVQVRLPALLGGPNEGDVRNWVELKPRGKILRKVKQALRDLNHRMERERNDKVKPQKKRKGGEPKVGKPCR